MSRVSLVVYGPQGCGKSINADKIRAAFGLDNIVDDWHGKTAIPFNGTLVLTCDRVAFNSVHGILRMEFNEAMRQADLA
ncbi:shikimate kinase 1 [Xanthomonas phage M29]|nr:shikimate kinase 1 [Xanthomonas phage M29]